MIKAAFEEAHTAEWVEKNIGNPNHDLVILRHIIPWEKITGSLTQFYDKDRGAEGKELRTMVAVTVVSRFHQFSDREAVRQVKENRYVQYFCNVADEELETFLHPSSLCVFRKRTGEKGAAVIEKEVFGMLCRAGAVEGDCALIDPEASATGEVLYRYFLATGAEIDTPMAAALYASILFDTGGFRFRNTRDETLLIAAELIRHGASHTRTAALLFENESFPRVELLTAALSRVVSDPSEVGSSLIDLLR